MAYEVITKLMFRTESSSVVSTYDTLEEAEKQKEEDTKQYLAAMKNNEIFYNERNMAFRGKDLIYFITNNPQEIKD